MKELTGEMLNLKLNDFYKMFSYLNQKFYIIKTLGFMLKSFTITHCIYLHLNYK